MHVRLPRRPAGVAVLLGLLALLGTADAGPPGDVKSLVADLKKGVAAQSHEQMQPALEGLIDLGGAEAVGEVLEIIPKLQRASDDIYWQLVNSAAGFRDAQALNFLGDWIVKHKKEPWARDLLFALENNRSPHAFKAQAQVLEKGPYDLQLMAADQLARQHTIDAVDTIVAALKREGDKGDPELRRRLMTGLTEITGQNMGDSQNWIGWWENNRKNGLPEKAASGGGGGGMATSAMDPNRKRDFESMARNPNRIVVISSRIPADAPKDANKDYNYDHMEGILSQMEIPHTVVLKQEFEKDPQKYLKDAWTVLVNCNNIQQQCICPDCIRILNEKASKGQNIGGVTNRLYTCPPECSKHDQVSYRMTSATIDAIKAWVERGGYLFTEDWGVVEIVEVAWPEIIKNSKKTRNPDGTEKAEYNLIRTTDVTITPGRGLTSLPLMRGVFARGSKKPAAPSDDGEGGGGDGGTRTRDLGEDNPTIAARNTWHIDDESPAVEVVDRAAVTVLIESEDLAKLSGGNETVAVNFRRGNALPKREASGGAGGAGGGGGRTSSGPNGGTTRGKDAWAEQLRGGSVLHCMSHFGKQQGKQEDTFVIQNLILNFIMESNRQHQ